MENLLEIMNEIATLERDKTDDLELKAEFQAILDFTEDIKAIENKANALSLSLDLFSGTPNERETKSSLSRQDIEAKIYALQVILNLISFKGEKLNT